MPTPPPDQSAGTDAADAADSLLDRFQSVFDRVPVPGELHRYAAARDALEVRLPRRLRPHLARVITRL
jgi:hypothetical protein